MPGREFSAGSGYRYGFNGKEKSDEIYGEGNAYDFGARIQDPRLGRWFSVDPLTSSYVGLSPYVFVKNMPISAFDPDGERIRAKTQENRQEVLKMFSEIGLDGAFRFNRRGILKINHKWVREKGEKAFESVNRKKIFEGVKKLSRARHSELDVTVTVLNQERWTMVQGYSYPVKGGE